MTYMQWVMRLPEVWPELIAKAKRVEALRSEAEDLENEVCRTVTQLWADSDVRLPGMIPAKQEPLSAEDKAKIERHLTAK